MSMDDWVRAKQFNPDVLQRESLRKIDIGYSKVLSKDSALLPLPHEKLPSTTIYKFGEPATVMSVGSDILQGPNYLIELYRLVEWLESFLAPLFGPGKMYKLIKTEKDLIVRTSNLKLIAKHLPIKHPLGNVIIGSGLSVSKLLGDHSVYTSLLATLIIRKCLELVLRGFVKMQDCLNGLVTFNRIFSGFLEEIRVTFSHRDSPDETVLRSAKIMDNEANTDTVIRLAVKIAGKIAGEILQNRPVDNLLDFRTMEMGLLSESDVVEGIALPKELPHSTLPQNVKNAKIAVVKDALMLPDYLGRHHKIVYSWDEAGNMSKGLENKSKLLRECVANILDVGANVLVVEKGVDENIFDLLVERGSLLVRGLSPPELELVAESTGARPVSPFQNLSPDDLGRAELVEYLKLNGKEWVFFRNCANLNRLTVIVKGCSFVVNQDFEETLKDAVRLVDCIRQDPSFVPGGGRAEVFIASRLREFAEKTGGRVSLVLKSIAEAFEQLVSILLQNMGQDSLEKLPELRLDLNTKDVLDSLPVKQAAIENATVASYTVLRVDSLIRARKYSDSEVSYLKRVRGLSKENKRRIRRDFGVETLEL